jgi:hypothetical protein
MQKEYYRILGVLDDEEDIVRSLGGEVRVTKRYFSSDEYQV